MSNSNENVLRVQLDDPHTLEGTVVSLPGLGTFENKRVREVTPEEVARYERKARRSFSDMIVGHPYLSFAEGTAPVQEPMLEPEQAVVEETPLPRRRKRGDEE